MTGPKRLAKDASGESSRVYPEALLEHYQHPRHRGLEGGEGHAVNPLCGDELHVSLSQGIAWDGVGCAISFGMASLLAERIAAGEDPLVVAGYGIGQLEKLAGGPLPGTRHRCALLFGEALADALHAGASHP